MNIHIRLLPGCLAAALLPLLLCSCVDKAKKSDTPPAAAAAAPQQHSTVVEPALLPTRFRQAGYMVSEEKDSNSSAGSGSSLDGLQLKVGANITTSAPIPLREAMKAIVKTKNMSLSWAPDVDQELLVDIDVNANDNFYEAIDNILRQLDYFHEIEGSTLIIKYRETKQYHVAMPFVNQSYSSAVGVEGANTSSLTIGSKDNKFDIWENIQKNIDKIIATWSSSVVMPEQPQAAAETKDPKKAADAKGGEEESVPAPLARRVSSTDSTYTIDKPIGLITVHAPQSLQKRVANYLSTLEKELYKQILIEAKIIEVQLKDSSSLGINWNTLLENLSVANSSYGKTKTYSRDSGDESRTKSAVDFSDTTTDTASKSSSTAYTVDGTSKQKDGSSSSTQKDGETVSDNQSTYVTGDGKSIDNLSSNLKSTLTGSLDEESSVNELNAASSSSDSSSNSNVRTVRDALSMGTTAATFLTSASGLGETISTGVRLTGFNFTSFIKALQEQGQTSILSNPKISVMNGQPALISVGRDVTYIKEIKKEEKLGTGATGTTTTTTATTGSILSGVGLALSAVIRNNNEIVMNLVPVTSELLAGVDGEIAYRTLEGGNQIGLPVVNKREMNTTVKIKDGSMLVVGGLISETDTKDGSYLPGAKNLPYLKYLFGYEEKKKTKRELIILLRPRIIN